MLNQMLQDLYSLIFTEITAQTFLKIKFVESILCYEIVKYSCGPFFRQLSGVK